MSRFLRQAVEQGKRHWDRPGERPAVRKEFQKLLLCGTAALGAEVYASATQQLCVYHTCKSRFCPSCGFKATLEWQQQQWAALPDTVYTGLVFTMPSSLWAIFQENRHLQHQLPALGAAVIQQWMSVVFNVEVMILIVPQSFNGKLQFNSHLHCMISGCGLRKSDGRWTPPLHFSNEDRIKLTRCWQDAVMQFLEMQLNSGALRSNKSVAWLRNQFRYEEEREWWPTFVRERMSKKQFLGYAARYIRRPPIAQNRILEVGDGKVAFLAWDKRGQRTVPLTYSVCDFIRLLSQHVFDEYKHAIRYFGLLAPRSKNSKFAIIFAQLGQQRRARPKRLGWRESIQRWFKRDPLLDRAGHLMNWVRRNKPNPWIGKHQDTT